MVRSYASLIGASWKIIACLCFAVSNGLSAWLLRDGFPPLILASLQYGIATLFLTGWCRHHRVFNIRPMLASSVLSLHVGRIFLSLAGVFLWQKALKYLPMAQIIALNFLGPIMTTTLACLFLKETLSWGRLAIILLSFVGGVFASSPRFVLGHVPYPDWGWSLIYPLGASVCWSLVTILSKKILYHTSQEEATWHLFLGLTVGFLALSYSESWLMLPWSLSTWLGLLGLGGLTGLAHLSLATAFQKADLLFLLPFGCVRCLLTIGIGLFWFKQPIHPLSGIGVGLILMSHGFSLISAFRDRQKGGAKRQKC